MYRVLLILVLAIVAFLLVRGALRQLRRRHGEPHALDAKDELIQDPVCRMYVTKASAVSARIGGRMHYFCSRNCAEAFEKQAAGSR
jgi:YHS domain-containing protein